eukprot:m.1516036 g.1516036  ORF g.1516036 m.1516036 type:complete len:815 (-) comp25217_c0_seq47:3019-5463(-)
MDATVVVLWEHQTRPSGSRWSAASRSYSFDELGAAPLERVDAEPGWSWMEKWHIDCGLLVADDGWQYQSGEGIWQPHQVKSRLRRRRWVRLRARRVLDSARPNGTGRFTFSLIFMHENQRDNGSVFTKGALQPTDHPPFSDTSGRETRDRCMTVGPMGASRYSVWRSTWRLAHDWEYAPRFDVAASEWKAICESNGTVRRRTWLQIVQCEYTEQPNDSGGGQRLGPGSDLAHPPSTPRGTPSGSAMPTPQTLSVPRSTNGQGATRARSDSPSRLSQASWGDAISLSGGGDGGPPVGLTAATPVDPALLRDLEWVWVDCAYDCDVDAMYAVLFHDTSAFSAELHKLKRFTNFTMTPWTAHAVGGCRSVAYVMPKSKLIKATPASERQTITVHRPGEMYVAEALQHAPTLPFGTSFKTRIKFVLQRKDSCHVRLSCQVEFSKSVFAKSLILSSAKKACKDGFNETKEFLFKWIRTHNIGAGPPRTVEESSDTESNTSTPLRAIAPAQRSTADGQPCRDTQADVRATNLSSCKPSQPLTITPAHSRAGDTVRKAAITSSTDTAEDPTPPLVTKGVNEESSAGDENDFETVERPAKDNDDNGQDAVMDARDFAVLCESIAARGVLHTAVRVLPSAVRCVSTALLVLFVHIACLRVRMLLAVFVADDASTSRCLWFACVCTCVRAAGLAWRGQAIRCRSTHFSSCVAPLIRSTTATIWITSEQSAWWRRKIFLPASHRSTHAVRLGWNGVRTKESWLHCAGSGRSWQSAALSFSTKPARASNIFPRRRTVRMQRSMRFAARPLHSCGPLMSHVSSATSL